MVIKIPTDSKTYSQPNTTDLFGNLYYTKNINLREKGYIKLASRSVSIQSEKNTANFKLPLAFGRTQNDGFRIATGLNNYILDLSAASFGVTADGGVNVPANVFTTQGCWFNNRWHVTTDTKMFWKGTVNWTDSTASLTIGVSHPVEVFRNKIQIAVGDANTVKLYDTNYSLIKTLTIPADYEVVGLSYANAKMGIITKLSTGATGQNQEAYFFPWDGATTSVAEGFATGSDMIVSITAYRTSWVLLTRTGKLLYFNGGGFEELTTLPYYFKNYLWSDSVNLQALGKCMQVDGDTIYINIPTSLNVFGLKNQTYQENYPGGVFCWDPAVGLHHQYSPSISEVSFLTVANSNINTATDTFTIVTADTIPITGNPIKYTSDINLQIGGLTVGYVYYIIRIDASNFKLATTKQNAVNGIAIDITSTGQTSNKFLALNVLDYGISYSTGRSGSVGLMSGQSLMRSNLVYGAEVQDYNSTNNYGTCCLTVPQFENRGYFVTAKVNSNAIEDNTEKIFIKYRPLGTNDKIIVKYKSKDVIGIPVTTPQNGLACTWTGTRAFTTTADISEVATYLSTDTDNSECEAEIINGAGAGQMAQIASVVLAGSTYTVTLTEDIDGATSGYVCNVMINNWKLLRTLSNASAITATDTQNWMELPLTRSPSKWFKFKIELRGVGVTIEELQIINSVQRQSE